MSARGIDLVSFSLIAIMILSTFLVLPLNFSNHSNAANSQSICSGGTAAGFQSIIENETNVTSKLSSVASGVSVKEITSSTSGYSASFVYYDTPVYSPDDKQVVYYVFEAHGPDLIVLANVDGTDPQVIGQSYTNPIITSDGK